MDTTMLVSLSHQVATYQSMDSIANNIANVSTAAFKRETPTFQEFISQVQPTEGDKGSKNVSYVTEAGVVRDESQGPIEATGNRLDFALKGSGYFAVQTANGEVYTRNGHFTLDQNGTLTTESGDQVETNSGPLNLSPQELNVSVGGDGTVSATINGTQAQLGQLKVVDFADDAALQKQGNSYYTTTQSATSAKANLVQGMLESSNVQPVVEISHMIEIMRSYQTTANLAQSHESLKMQALDKLAQTQD
jgi:flagellar basal-body rod protein FlgF